MAPRRTNSSWFILQVVLLGAPFLVLVILGLHLLRLDKSSVEKEAREKGEGVARETLVALAKLSANFNASPLNLGNKWPNGMVFLQVDSDLNLQFPTPIRKADGSDPVVELASYQSNLWVSAQRAEFETNDLEGALQFWKELLDSDLPSKVRPVALFQQAVVAGRLQHWERAEASLRAAALAPIEARLESGIPVANLASFKLLQRAAARGKEESEEMARFCVSNLLTKATEFTAQFLAAGRQTLTTNIFTEAEGIWAQHELARALHLKISESYRRTEGSSAPGSSPIFVPFATNIWCARAQGTSILVLSVDLYEQLAEQTLAPLRSALPPYLVLSFALGERTFLGFPSNASAQATLLSRVTVVDDPSLRCDVLLSDPPALYAKQRQRAQVFGGLLSASGACAAFGIIYAQRNYRRQQRLADLKSNFVSSVTHELRAPLASMRLMAEGLQSGRVHNLEKQREYFNYLVDECRRLSTLVENVLNFSRIEQDRKVYEFEEMPLLPLCQRAIQTVAPASDERGVKLTMETAEKDENASAKVDGLALQQAIVNLLDNSIKHSPAGETVTLSLRASNDAIEIGVHDKGPGIDPSEHQRIFERFYRLGSELRRETQGVGIGLSIVKHTIEAHGGTVTVDSSPRRGATFTLHLPRSHGKTA